MTEIQGFQDEPNTKVSIVKGGLATPTVEAVGKMLWLEGFAYPQEKGSDGELHYAVVTRAIVEAVLTKLYQVDVSAKNVLRWLRQVGLIKYAPALISAKGPMTFRYTCANPARGRDPKTIEDVEQLIDVIASVRAMIGTPPPEPDEDDEDASREQVEVDIHGTEEGQ